MIYMYYDMMYMYLQSNLAYRKTSTTGTSVLYTEGAKSCDCRDFVAGKISPMELLLSVDRSDAEVAFIFSWQLEFRFELFH